MLFFYRKTEDGCGFTQTSASEKECWIHAEAPTEEDFAYICQRAGLHKSDVSDALDRYEIPRLEMIQESLILFVRYPIDQEKHLHTMPLTIILSSACFITISLQTSSFIKDLFETKNLFSSYDPIELLIQIFLKISQEFHLQIRKARHEVMASGKEIGSVVSEDISMLTEYEEILNQYLASLTPFADVLQKLINSSWKLLTEKTRRELDDILNATKQSDYLCSSLIKNIRNLRDSYQIVFANSLTKTIKLLTALTIIFSIPNIVASIYGMNVKLPLAGSSHAFSLLMGIMFIVSILCGYWFYRKKWM